MLLGAPVSVGAVDRREPRRRFSTARKLHPDPQTSGRRARRAVQAVLTTQQTLFSIQIRELEQTNVNQKQERPRHENPVLMTSGRPICSGPGAVHW
jgi:hypothetical protein